MKKDKKYEFLVEYEILCKKYKMGLKGCGCCGSPFLGVSFDNECINEINYNEKLDTVFIGGDGWANELLLEGDEIDKKYLDKTIDEYFKED